MSALYYLLEANAYLLVFYTFYRIVLRNETFYTLNRFYLLVTGLLSFLLPGIQLSGLNAEEVQYVMNSSPVVIQQPITFWTPFHIGIIVYLIVAAFFLVKLGLRLQHISLLVKQGRIKQQDGFKQVEIAEHALPFSFLNYLFINPDIPKMETIIRHEQVHIRQWHSADILFFEILQIINWFNPLISRMQADIKTLHEYIADERTASQESSAADYALFLINHSYGIDQAGLSNQMFSRTLLKKRIEMLNRKRSGQKALLKYTLLLLLMPMMLCASALAFTKTYGVIDLMPVKAYEVSQQDTTKKLPPPPPPPEPPKPRITVTKFPPPAVVPPAKKAASGQTKKLPPPPPEPSKPRVTVTKFPPLVVKEQPPTVEILKVASPQRTKTKTVTKFPPPVVVADPGQSKEMLPPPPPEPPKPKVDQVKFPPPVVVPPAKKAAPGQAKKLLAPPPPEPPKPRVTVTKFPPPVVVPPAKKAAPGQAKKLPVPPPPEPPKPKVSVAKYPPPPEPERPKETVTKFPPPIVVPPAKKAAPGQTKKLPPPPEPPKSAEKESQTIPKKSNQDLIEAEKKMDEWIKRAGTRRVNGREVDRVNGRVYSINGRGIKSSGNNELRNNLLRKSSDEQLNNLLHEADQRYLNQDWEGLKQVADKIKLIDKNGKK